MARLGAEGSQHQHRRDGAGTTQALAVEPGYTSVILYGYRRVQYNGLPRAPGHNGHFASAIILSFCSTSSGMKERSYGQATGQEVLIRWWSQAV